MNLLTKIFKTVFGSKKEMERTDILKFTGNTDNPTSPVETIVSNKLNSNNKPSEELVTITSKNTASNTTEIAIKLNENEFLRRAKNGTLGTGTREPSIEDITGFYGSEQFSPNKIYCISYNDGHFENDKWKNGNIALIKDSKLLFKRKLQRPDECFVSNDGIVICCDGLNSDALTGKFLILDSSGKQMFSKITTANLGNCAISNNSEIALFETFASNTDDGHKFFIVDVVQRQIIQKFERPASFNSAEIDTENKRIKLKDHRGFIYEIDFEGNQTNEKQYENQILTEGSIYDRLCLYANKPNEAKLKDANYLDLLTKAITDKDASYSFGKDGLYRMIGEYYEANGDILKTIKNWEKAIEINPKIGIKRKLDALKKKI